MILVRDAGLEQQTNKQKKAQTPISYSLFKVQCVTIHLVGSLCGLGLVFYQISTREPILYFVALYRKGNFSLSTTCTKILLAISICARMTTMTLRYGVFPLSQVPGAKRSLT